MLWSRSLRRECPFKDLEECSPTILCTLMLMYPATGCFFHTPHLECSSLPDSPLLVTPPLNPSWLLALSPASALPLLPQPIGPQFWYPAFLYPIYNPGPSFLLGILSLVPSCVRLINSTGAPNKEPLSFYLSTLIYHCMSLLCTELSIPFLWRKCCQEGGGTSSSCHVASLFCTHIYAYFFIFLIGCFGGNQVGWRKKYKLVYK